MLLLLRRDELGNVEMPVFLLDNGIRVVASHRGGGGRMVCRLLPSRGEGGRRMGHHRPRRRWVEVVEELQLHKGPDGRSWQRLRRRRRTVVGHFLMPPHE